MSNPYTLLQQDDPDNLLAVVHSTERESVPDPSQAYKWIFSRGCQILTVIIACVLFALGFLLCRIFFPRPCCSSPFNYNTFYGIPANLPVIPSDGLVNHTELDLKTGFLVSSVTQTREYTFNITQALAAPDGFRKPMILINNHFPGMSSSIVHMCTFTSKSSLFTSSQVP